MPLVVIAEEVLHLREHPHVLGVAAAQPVRVGGDHGADVERVLAEALLVAPGERIRADVGDGPEGGQGLGVALAHLGGDDLADAFEQFGVPRGAEPDGLGEEGRVGMVAGAVEDLGELVAVLGKGVAVGEDGLGDAVEAGELLLVAHEGQDGLDAFGDRPGGVEVSGY